jgi:hypothetical protein
MLLLKLLLPSVLLTQVSATLLLALVVCCGVRACVSLVLPMALGLVAR